MYISYSISGSLFVFTNISGPPSPIEFILCCLGTSAFGRKIVTLLLSNLENTRCKYVSKHPVPELSEYSKNRLLFIILPPGHGLHSGVHCTLGCCKIENKDLLVVVLYICLQFLVFKTHLFKLWKCLNVSKHDIKDHIMNCSLLLTVSLSRPATWHTSCY